MNRIARFADMTLYYWLHRKFTFTNAVSMAWRITK